MKKPKVLWWAAAAAGWGRRQPVSHLHGCRHRLCPAGVWAHGYLHQVWQAHEWVSHLPAVCGASRARVQVLKLRLPSPGQSPPNLTPNISMHRRDWKATVQRLKLFLNVIFTTKWGQKDPPELWKHWSMPWACLPVDTWASGLSWALSHIPWTLIEVSLFVPCGHQPLLSWEDTYPVLLFLLHPIFNLNCSDVWNFCPLWMRSVSTSGRHGTCWTVAPLNVHFISHVYFKC